jgi:hypothetical protein
MRIGPSRLTLRFLAIFFLLLTGAGYVIALACPQAIANYLAGIGIAINGSTISTSTVPTGVVNVITDEGAKGNGVMMFDGQMASGSAHLVPAVITVTSCSVSSGNVATITLASNGPYWPVGTSVTFASSTDASCNGTFNLTEIGPCVGGGCSATGGALTAAQVQFATSGGASSGTGGTATGNDFSFASGDAGKAICVDQVGSANVQVCGTISTFNSSADVSLSFTNGSGGNVVGAQFAYGTPDDAAIDAGTAALAAAQGGQEVFPPGVYIRTTSMVVPINEPISVIGSGNSLPGIHQTCCYAGSMNKNGSVILWLTKGLSGGGIIFSGINGQANGVNGSFVGVNRLSDIGIWAGTGFEHDGGGNNGISIMNWQGLSVERVSVKGWASDGIEIWNGTTGYIAKDEVSDSFVQDSGKYGIEVGPTGSGGVPQDVGLHRDWIWFSQKDGIIADTEVHDLTIDQDTVSQYNDQSQTAGLCEITFTASCKGCLVDGTYTEGSHVGGGNNDGSLATGLCALATGAQVSPNFIGNYISVNLKYDATLGVAGVYGSTTNYLTTGQFMGNYLGTPITGQFGGLSFSNTWHSDIFPPGLFASVVGTPYCNSVNVGFEWDITDAISCAFGATPASGSSSTYCPLKCNGSAMVGG